MTDGRHRPRPRAEHLTGEPRHRRGRAGRSRSARNPYLAGDGRRGRSERTDRPRDRAPQRSPRHEVEGDIAHRPSALRRFGRGVGVAGGGAALLGALAISLFPTQTFLEQRATTAEVEERLEVLRAQNDAFEDRIEALQTEEEIERLAREQYNLAYPGEEAYAVLPAPLPPLDLPPLWPYGEIYAPALSSGEVSASLDEP